MFSTYCYLDYEYRNTSEQRLEVVCCSILVRKSGETVRDDVVWLHRDDAAQADFFGQLQLLRQGGAVFLAYGVTADAGATISLLPEAPTEVTEWPWIDLLTEVKQVRNGNYKRLFGKYVDKNGGKKTSYPPVVDERGKVVSLDKKDPKKRNNAKTSIDLSSTLWAFLGVEPDLQHKNNMRDVILRGGYSDDEKQSILAYAHSDTINLPNLFKVLQSEIRTLTRQTFDSYIRDTLVRGEWSARLALMERRGMPLDLSRLQRIAKSRETILDEWIGMLVDKYFPFYERNNKGSWVFKDTRKQEFVVTQGFEHEWKKSKKTGKYSFASEVLENYEDLLPEIKELTRIRSFESQTRSYSKATKFTDVTHEHEEEDEVSTENKENIFQRIGGDSRLRSYFNPYGTQTGRNAPPARSFILAQSKWIRSCMRPPEGWQYTSIDYAAEEFLIAACESGDINMMLAYDTPTAGGEPDVYLNFAVLANAAPKTATKKTHGLIRTVFKTVVLGKQFSLGVDNMRVKLAAATGRKDFPLSEAQRLNDLHKQTFSTYWDWVREITHTYRSGIPLKTRDGLYLFCDNPNTLSAGNFPIQGAGGAILRNAVRYAQRAGVLVIAPLHDALYILHKEGDREPVEACKKAMNQAFRDYYGRDIRMESKTWGPRDEFIEEGGEETFTLLCKHFMSEEEFEHWPLATNIVG